MWCWDITYLRAPTRGAFFYLYLFLDVWSRKIVGWRVHDCEDNELSAKAFVVLRSGRRRSQEAGPVLRLRWADEGGHDGRHTRVARSLSRPSVSNDNPFVESTFRTVKGRPNFPDEPFASREAAATWGAEFVAWYNEEHRHSGISLVTPGQPPAFTKRSSSIVSASTLPPRLDIPSAGPATFVAGTATRPSDSTHHTCSQQGRTPRPTAPRRETTSCGNFLEIHRSQSRTPTWRHQPPSVGFAGGTCVVSSSSAETTNSWATRRSK